MTREKYLYMMEFMKLKKIAKKNTVFVVALIAAVLSCLFVPPNEKYMTYVDGRTIGCLFGTLAVIGALRNIRFFKSIARWIIAKTGNTRTAVITLVCITFIGSMLIANDMALITFLPLGFVVLSSTKKEKYMAFAFVMQNIAANLGGMLTPFGNPQNLFLYSYFNIPNDEFIKIMFAPFALAVSLIFVCCWLFVKKEKLILPKRKIKLPPIRTTIYLMLFAFAIAIVFRIVPYLFGIIVIAAALWMMDKKALKKLDYPLLGTFFCFFIFAGNVSQMESIHAFFDHILSYSVLLVSVLSCQFISNVPTAILLSRFTENYPDLLVGVNIGGVGTLVASLASLITFREYTKRYPHKTKSYLKTFFAFNFFFLIVLTGFCLIK